MTVTEPLGMASHQRQLLRPIACPATPAGARSYPLGERGIRVVKVGDCQSAADRAYRRHGSVAKHDHANAKTLMPVPRRPALIDTVCSVARWPVQALPLSSEDAIDLPFAHSLGAGAPASILTAQ
jgi:hypothetical protein